MKKEKTQIEKDLDECKKLFEKAMDIPDLEGMVDGDAKNLYQVMMDAPMFGTKRKSHTPQDFGDDATVGKCLKVIGKTLLDEYKDYDFGMYLGKQNGKYHVGMCEMMSFTPSKLESFDSLESLKEKWELD